MEARVFCHLILKGHPNRFVIFYLLEASHEVQHILEVGELTQDMNTRGWGSSGAIVEAAYHQLLRIRTPSSKAQSWKGLEHQNGSLYAKTQL